MNTTVNRILIVDDEFSIAETLSDLLRWEGFDTSVVADAAAALASLRTRLPDLVLLDYMLPGLDGLALLGLIRNEAAMRDLPVILMTAARLSAGPCTPLWTALLLKPFTADQLVRTVRQLLPVR